MKSLRTTFVRHITAVFLAIFIFLFVVFAGAMMAFFFNTVEKLDRMENRLSGEEMDVYLSEYRTTTESLAKNANLVEMLVKCQTPEAFNTDHNFDLIVESMERTQSEQQKQASELWVYSLEHAYEMRGSRGTAELVNLSKQDKKMLNVLRKKFDSTLFIEYTLEDGSILFNVITPVKKEGKLWGMIGTSVDLKVLLEEVEGKASINNMITDCSLIIPTLDEQLSVSFYNAYYLEGKDLRKKKFTYNVEEKSETVHSKDGKQYISAVGTSGWYLASYVPNATVWDAFITNYGALGGGIYLVVLIGMLAVVILTAHRIMKPIHELDALVDNIRNHKPYTKPKGNNEVSRAADSLVELVNDNSSLLTEIRELAEQIERGELFTRFRSGPNENTQHEIKKSLNHMLNNISYILDNLSVGIAIIDEKYHVIYINANVRNLTGIDRLKKDVEVEEFTQVSEKDRRKICCSIDNCREGIYGQEEMISVGGKHLIVSTTKLHYTGQDEKNEVFLQLYSNQTDIIGKIREQEQIFAYFDHLSLVKKEALERLAKGDFKRAVFEIGSCPSAPYLKGIYQNQIEMRQAFSETVNNVESIITELEKATKAFADGNLHMAVNMHNAKGKYGELAKTANNAFHVILNYFQYIPIPVRIIDREYQVRFFNEASYEGGFRPGQDVKCYQWYNESEPCSSCPFKAGGKQISVLEYSSEINGHRMHWRRYRNPLLDEDGNIVSILEVLIDETRIVELKKEADSANMAKSLFIANMSHEIRTPMNAILGYSQLMEMSAALSEKDRGYVETIKRSGNHLLSLINDILELSKIEAGKITLGREKFDLNSLLEDVRAVFVPQIKTKGLRLDIKTKEKLQGELIGDTGKIRQIIFNVVSNAVKFTSVGVVALDVSTKLTGHGNVRIIIDVTDTGCGIAEEEWDKVFNAFEQAEGGIRSGAGTGLGMAISRNFARMMHGDLEIRSSELGKGSTFRIFLELPMGEPDEKRQSNSKPYNRIIGLCTPRTVLIVDAVEDNREMLQKILLELGFTVIIAQSNEQALHLWQDKTPDLLTTDLSDGDLKGIELVRQIRALERNRYTISHSECSVPASKECIAGGSDEYTPIIVITADAFDQKRAEAIDAGADVFMTKPLLIEALAREIERLTDVQYLFGAEKAERVAETDSKKERLEGDMKVQIREAVVRGDFDKVIALAASIAKECPLLSGKLTEYADDFNQEAICSLMDEDEEEG